MMHAALGDGTTTIRKTPIPVPGLANIVRIAAGHDHSLALAADGTVWAWGRNAQGQIGDGTTTDRWAPVAISGPGLTWRAPTPVISLPAGTYSANQSTTVTSIDPEATMRYTLTGAEPTESDPIITSGTTLSITASQTVKVKAWKVWTAPSVTAVATYILQPALPSLSPGTGVYTTAQTVTMTTSTPGATIRAANLQISNLQISKSPISGSSTSRFPRRHRNALARNAARAFAAQEDGERRDVFGR